MSVTDSIVVYFVLLFAVGWLFVLPAVALLHLMEMLT